MQLGFHFDQTRCTGCQACVVACKDWKDLSPGSLRQAQGRLFPAQEDLSPDPFPAREGERATVAWPAELPSPHRGGTEGEVPASPTALLRIVAVEEGRFPHVRLSFFPLACFHCARPACIDVCPTEALRKRAEDGVVVVDDELCLIGCRLCADACPYEAPQFLDGATACLCDLCPDRREAGDEPICVAACPQRALAVGPLEELGRSHGGETVVRGFPEPRATGPSILFRGKRMERD